jgi:hypothetical protein
MLKYLLSFLLVFTSVQAYGLDGDDFETPSFTPEQIEVAAELGVTEDQLFQVFAFRKKKSSRCRSGSTTSPKRSPRLLR